MVVSPFARNASSGSSASAFLSTSETASGKDRIGVFVNRIHQEHQSRTTPPIARSFQLCSFFNDLFSCLGHVECCAWIANDRSSIRKIVTSGNSDSGFPGNANGPFLGNGPLGFHPVHDFRQVFRFDLTPEQVKQRWDRVTSTSIGKSYRGLRVALVTGVNPWDLHGSIDLLL